MYDAIFFRVSHYTFYSSRAIGLNRSVETVFTHTKFILYGDASENNPYHLMASTMNHGIN